MSKLYEWKTSLNRKPLLLLGARQVGKTWIIKKFGSDAYNETHYFDFSENLELEVVFKNSTDPVQIIKDLELLQDKKINIENELVIFDEIQSVPSALKSVKYFCERVPDLHLVCAGSLLGVGLINESFPVGKISYLDMYPLSFEEFIEATAGEILFEEYKKILHTKKTSQIVHNRLMKILRDYWITGGLPEVVREYLIYRENPYEGYKKARDVQNNLLRDYLNDFSKHAGKLNASHIRQVFQNIPLQLAANIDSSTQRYMFKDVLPGKKGFMYLEGPISWLEYAGLIYKVSICNSANVPLKAYTKPNIFKLQLFDIGLLGAMLELSPKTIINDDYGITKGYFAESFVLGELRKSIQTSIYSWNERNSEIEFIIAQDGNIIPIEVKSSKRTKAKSLAQYLIKYNPGLAIKLMDAPLNPVEKQIVWNIPLYLAGKLKELM